MSKSQEDLPALATFKPRLQLAPALLTSAKDRLVMMAVLCVINSNQPGMPDIKWFAYIYMENK